MRRESKEEAASTKPRKKKQLNIHVLDYKIPWSLENPTKLHSYNGNGDPDEHIEHVDGRLD